MLDEIDEYIEVNSEKVIYFFIVTFGYLGLQYITNENKIIDHIKANNNIEYHRDTISDELYEIIEEKNNTKIINEINEK